jgi:hypothetical protein
MSQAASGAGFDAPKDKSAKRPNTGLDPAVRRKSGGELPPNPPEGDSNDDEVQAGGGRDSRMA